MINPESIENNFFHTLQYQFDAKKIKQGVVLLSDPFLLDPFFVRTVILITRYDKNEGATGFILNRPTRTELCDTVSSFHGRGYELHHGGPVDADSVFFIHQNDLGIVESVKVTRDLSWSNNFDEITELYKIDKLPPTEVKFFTGYCGWGPTQLEQEIEEKSWIVTSMDAEKVLNGQENLMWKQSLKQMGRKFSIMADFPENPNLN